MNNQNKLEVAKRLKSISDRLENIREELHSSDLQHFDRDCLAFEASRLRCEEQRILMSTM